MELRQLRCRLAVADMANEPLIVPDRGSRPHSHDLTIKLFLDAGYSARITQIAEEKQTIINLVSTGVGLAIVPRLAARLAVGGVTFVPLTTLPAQLRDRLALSAVWVKDTRHPARTAFLEAMQDRLSEVKQSA